MLGKLIKYDLKASGILIPVFLIATVVLGLIIGFFVEPAFASAPFGFLIIFAIYMVILVVLLIEIIVNVIRRFYKDMMTTDGYLLNMLPVPAWQHIIAKLIGSLIWVALAFAAILVSFRLLTAFDSSMTAGFLEYMLEDVTTAGIVVYAFVLFVDLVSMILCVYVSILFGGLANNRKKLFALLTFIALIIVCNVLAWALGISADVYNPDAKQLAFYGILALFFFFASRDLLAKKLNLT